MALSPRLPISPHYHKFAVTKETTLGLVQQGKPKRLRFFFAASACEFHAPLQWTLGIVMLTNAPTGVFVGVGYACTRGQAWAALHFCLLAARRAVLSLR